MSSCLIPSGMRPCTHHRLFQSDLRLWFSWVVCCHSQRLSSVSGWVGWIKIEGESTKLFCFPHIAQHTVRSQDKTLQSRQKQQPGGWHRALACLWWTLHQLTWAHSCAQLHRYNSLRDIIYIYIYSYSISNPLYTHTSTYTSRFSWSSAAGAKSKGQGATMHGAELAKLQGHYTVPLKSDTVTHEASSV